jgi:hypothetical protein
MDKPEDLIAKLIDFLDEGALVTKFIVIAEAIDTNGERAVYISTDDKAMPQDTMGMLDYALERERAGVIRSVLGEE